MSADKDLKRVEDSVEALSRLLGSHRAVARRAEVSGVDLGRTAQHLLWFIVTEGPIRISDLARAARTTDPIVSRQVAALEAEGYVERRASPQDGRVSLIRATAEGRRAGRRLRRAADEIFRSLLEGWTNGELAELAPLLERLVGDLQSRSDGIG